MPTYEYHCSKCKTRYELREGFEAATLHPCQQCRKGTAKRVLHAPRVVFKGSGFYATDNRSKSTPVSDSKDGVEKSEPAEKPAEVKPAATPSTESAAAS
jgi:putative FmdB family regulatory protein